MFVQTINDDLLNTRYIVCIANKDNYIICRTLNNETHQLYYSENIDYLMKEKLSWLLSVKKLTTDNYTQEQLIRDMK
jgi:hypothetical protein